MKHKAQDNIVVALDIGTSKVVTIVGQVNEDDTMEIIGLGSHPCKGLKRGVVVNIEETINAINKSIEEAELMAGCRIHSVYAGIAGEHVASLNSQGVVALKDKEVTPMDVARVIDTARAVNIPAEHKILHILPQEFIIDDHEGIKEPVGMSGIRLQAKVHLITCAVNAAQNIEKCIKRCGLEVNELILEQLASSQSVLTEDEKELGVCLVDIGGGTSDIAVFTNGSIRYVANIAVAGDQVTSDIAQTLRTPTRDADEIKKRYACALTQLAQESEVIQVPSVGERPPRELSRQRLAEVVEPRYEEIFTMILNELRRFGYDEIIPAGVVLTGGASKIQGAVELAEEVFHMPVRVGVPSGVEGLSDVVSNPIYATGVGLINYANQLRLEGDKYSGRAERAQIQSDKPSLWSMFKNWLKGF